MSHPNELPIPPRAANNPTARELVRVWAAGGNQQMVLRASIWSDPAAWGILLVDLARHVSLAYQHESGLDPASSLSRIREGFDVEWDNPTDLPEGGLMP